MQLRFWPIECNNTTRSARSTRFNLSRARFRRVNRIASNIDRPCSANYVLSKDRKERGAPSPSTRPGGSFVSRDYENRNYTVNNVPVGALFRLRYEYLLAILFSIKVELTCHGWLKDQSCATFLIVRRVQRGERYRTKRRSTQNVR